MDLTDLAVFASLEGLPFLSTQRLPDRVHTVYILMVGLTFLDHLGKNGLCDLGEKCSRLISVPERVREL
jgi:hypothetical protein